MVWPNRGAAWANLLTRLNVLNCCKVVTGVGKRQHFLCRCGPSVIAMLFVEALGRPIVFFHISPSQLRRRRWRARWRNIVPSMPRDPGALWRAIAASSLLRWLRFTWTIRCPPAGHRVLGEAKRRAVDPRCSYWPPGRAPGAARVQEERPLPAAGAASDPTRMTPHESALWRTGRG